MVDSRPGAEKVQLESKTTYEQKKKELLKINWILSKGHRSQIESAPPIGQTCDK